MVTVASGVQYLMHTHQLSLKLALKHWYMFISLCKTPGLYCLVSQIIKNDLYWMDAVLKCGDLC